MKYISYYSVLDYFALALRFMALVVTDGRGVVDLRISQQLMQVALEELGARVPPSPESLKSGG